VGTTVVIADDQPMVRAGLRSLLEGESGVLVVAEAVDGEQAVAEVRRHRPDVVLMDIRMPNMDGSRRRDNSWQKKPVPGSWY